MLRSYFRWIISVMLVITFLLSRSIAFQRISLISYRRTTRKMLTSTSPEIRSPSAKEFSFPEISTNSTQINLKAIKDGVSRQYLRSIKKMTKLLERVEKQKSSFAKEGTEEAKALADGISLEEEYNEMKGRVEKLKGLEESLAPIKSAADPALLQYLPLLDELQIKEGQSKAPERGAKKIKSPPPPPRKPYFVYQSKDGIEIYVGRRAEDNDEVSCNPEHRHPDEWWLHVSGYGGSHVVIKNTDDALPTIYRETVLDAAVLAAVNSRASNAGRVTVSLTRCRNVSKPRGVPAGTVQLSGDIRSITFDLKTESKRLERLQKIR